MRERTIECCIPASLVPRCPVCGGPMDVNIRKNAHFVEGEAWHKAGERYGAFLQAAKKGRTVFLELGVGFNTPSIIRFPFERMVFQSKEVHLIRMNAHDLLGPKENAGKTISFKEDIAETLHHLLGGQDA